MKRILVWALLLMLLPAALAEDAYTAFTAQYDALLQREEAIQLELQIADLELQLARINKDEAALSAAELKKLSLENELAALAKSQETLAAQSISAITEEQQRLTQEAADLQSQMTLLQSALEENAAQQEALQARFEECMELSALRASAKGFLSEVTVYVMLDEAGAISALHVDASRETPFMGSRCGEDKAFLGQFTGRTGPFILGTDVDALSGATVTSHAVVDAVNSLFPTQDTPDSLVRTEYSASARGLLSDVWVTITLNEDGAIATMSVDCSGETEAIARPCTEEAFLSQFIGRRGPFTDIDVVAGATYTSSAVIEAVNSLFNEEGADLK